MLRNQKIHLNIIIINSTYPIVGFFHTILLKDLTIGFQHVIILDLDLNPILLKCQFQFNFQNDPLKTQKL